MNKLKIKLLGLKTNINETIIDTFLNQLILLYNETNIIELIHLKQNIKDLDCNWYMNKENPQYIEFTNTRIVFFIKIGKYIENSMDIIKNKDIKEILEESINFFKLRCNSEYDFSSKIEEIKIAEKTKKEKKDEIDKAVVSFLAQFDKEEIFTEILRNINLLDNIVDNFDFQYIKDRIYLLYRSLIKHTETLFYFDEINDSLEIILEILSKIKYLNEIYEIWFKSV